MEYWVCPICGTCDEPDECTKNTSSDKDFLKLYCHHFDFEFYLHQDIYDNKDNTLKEKLLNLITEHLMHNRVCKINDSVKLWYFYYNDVCEHNYSKDPEYINLADHIKNYPTQVIDIAHRSLINISLKYSHYGEPFFIERYERRLCFEHNETYSRTGGFIKLLKDLGYVNAPENKNIYTITAAGWQKIEQLQKNEQIINQGFIAMAFRGETESIRESFRTAIKELGYSVRIIDEKEHNNQIVPEIFYEIERSKFVVVDVTYPNYGAYYEAGYAQALGKQVIICCREEEFKNPNSRPHFDISQKSMIVWKDESDLITRLKRRIVATVR